jgi:formiminotetrahydrofolate cyclodeaminase
VEEFTARLAAGTPTPGGGSAAALAGGLAAALVQMVCDLTIGKEAYRSHDAALRVMRDRAVSLRRELLELVDRDAHAYDQVVEARRKPRTTDAEKAARQDAIARAILIATEVPLLTAEACAGILTLGVELAAKGNRNAASDVGTAAVLAQAGLTGALMNVRSNLSGLADQERAVAISERVQNLETESLNLRTRCIEILQAGRA